MGTDNFMIGLQFQRLKHTFDHLKKINNGTFSSNLHSKLRKEGITPTELYEKEQAKTNEAVNTYLFELKENINIGNTLNKEQFK